jgi:hypothetical protein
MGKLYGTILAAAMAALAADGAFDVRREWKGLSLSIQ